MQKGPGVNISLTGDAPVFGNGQRLGLAPNGAGSAVGYLSMTNNVGAILRTGDGSEWDSEQTAFVTSNKSKSGLLADLSDVSAITINGLRTAFQMQKFYERLARGGSRYTEVLRSFFGVVSPDARLQRPEFLGSFTKMVLFLIYLLFYLLSLKTLYLLSIQHQLPYRDWETNREEIGRAHV